MTPASHAAFHQFALAVGAQQHHRRHAFLGEHLGRLDAVHVRHLDVHDHDIRSQLTGLVDRTAAIRHLADHQVTQVSQHLPQIHADQRLVVRDYDTCAFHCQVSFRLRT